MQAAFSHGIADLILSAPLKRMAVSTPLLSLRVSGFDEYSETGPSPAPPDPGPAGGMDEYNGFTSNRAMLTAYLAKFTDGVRTSPGIGMDLET